MPESGKKEHICTRMVDYIESKGLVVGKWEAENGISGGYLRRSAKDEVSIGFDLIENFLEKFPEVDLNWLIKGQGLSRNTYLNGTSATNNDEAVEMKKLISELKKDAELLRAENRGLKKTNSDQAKAILNLSVKIALPDKTQ